MLFNDPIRRRGVGAAVLVAATALAVLGDNGSARGELPLSARGVALSGGAGTPQSPAALFTADPAEPLAGTPVSLDGSASHVDGGTIVSWTWRFGDGTEATGPVISHVYGPPGTYQLTLTVTSDAGLTDTATRMITVTPALSTAGPPPTQSGSAHHSPPSVSVTVTPSHPRTGQRARFTAHAAGHAARIVRYSWTFGDGGRSGATAPTHIYRRRGTFRVSVTVTDDHHISTRRGLVLRVR